MTIFHCVALFNFCVGQDTKEGSFKLLFDEYRMDSCLYDILAAIVETDSAQKRFPADIYFYDFLYGNYIHYRDFIIRPKRWYKTLSSDMRGVVVVEGAKFVLVGQIEQDSLFSRTNNQIEISVTNPVPPFFDSLDNEKKWLVWDRSPTALVGAIQFCGGSSINLRVDVDKKIERLNLAAKYP